MVNGGEKIEDKACVQEVGPSVPVVRRYGFP